MDGEDSWYNIDSNMVTSCVRKKYSSKAGCAAMVTRFYSVVQNSISIQKKQYRVIIKGEGDAFIFRVPKFFYF